MTADGCCPPVSLVMKCGDASFCRTGYREEPLPGCLHLARHRVWPVLRAPGKGARCCHHPGTDLRWPPSSSALGAPLLSSSPAPGPGQPPPPAPTGLPPSPAALGIPEGLQRKLPHPGRSSQHSRSPRETCSPRGFSPLLRSPWTGGKGGGGSHGDAALPAWHRPSQAIPIPAPLDPTLQDARLESGLCTTHSSTWTQTRPGTGHTLPSLRACPGLRASRSGCSYCSSRPPPHCRGWRCCRPGLWSLTRFTAPISAPQPHGLKRPP